MSKTLLVMVQEIKATMRRKVFLLFGFGVPVLLGLVAVIVMAINRDATSEAYGENGPGSPEKSALVTEGLVDEGNLIEFLPAGLPEDWLVEYPNVATARSALEVGEIETYYVIPADYVETGNYTYVKPTHNPLGDDLQTRNMEWLLLANMLGNESLAMKVQDPLELEVISMAPPGASEAQDNWLTSFLPNLMALILYMVIIMSSSVLVAAMTDEKKNRVLEVLLSSVSTRQLITGKILAVGILGVLMMALWVLVLWSVANFGGQPLSIPQDFELPIPLLLWACVYALLGYAIYGSQMAGLGALAPDVKDSRSVSFIVLIPLIAVYMFLLVIITKPDSPLAIFLSLFPLTSPVGMITRMVVTEVPAWQSALAALLQIAAAIFIVRFVARLFRAQALLSGQPLSLKRFFGALLGKA
jgi:ABC-2 type transport system permease protein